MASIWSRLSKAFGGRGAKTKTIKTSSPLQDQLLALIQQGLGGEGMLGGALGGYNPEEIAKLFQQGVADPARQQYFERSVPQLEQRAIASGVYGASGLQDKIGRGAMDLESMLASNLAQTQLGARQGDLNRQLQALGLGLGTPTQQTAIVPGRQGLLESMLTGGAEGIGKGIGSGFTGLGKLMGFIR